MSRIAIIGTGIAGLGCVYYFLHQRCDLMVFETNAYAGGHTNTLEAVEPGTGKILPIDTGFMVFNRVTYLPCPPSFPFPRAWGSRSGQPRCPSVSAMPTAARSFAARRCSTNLFAQRRNPFCARVFTRLAGRHQPVQPRGRRGSSPCPRLPQLDLGEYLQERHYGEDFTQLYLLRR